MMNEFVLVPEGKFDFDWLNFLMRAVELDQRSVETCLFGVRVGLIPTSEAKMKETCEALSKAHSHVSGLVDGDGDGDRYASELRSANVGARRILHWPTGWTIEDVVGWILEADEAGVMQQINRDLAVAPGDRATLLTRLKSDDRAQHGLKGNLVAYEIVANALADRPLCVERARTVLDSVAQACAGVATPHFEQVDAGQVPRFVFRPCP